MDDGPTDGPPGDGLRTAWVELTAEEASELLGSLKVWAEEVEDGQLSPGWHTHVIDGEGRELTISVRLAGEPSARQG